ncbi:MAG: Clp protease [Pseudobdellovibrio sp.]|jgi:hypothetical protein|nr:Clp protease [Pseudobdellovibrio sp.]
MRFLFLFLVLAAQSTLAFSVKLEGPVSPGSVQAVMNSVNTHMSAGETDMTLRLESDGGEIPSAVKLANFLREKMAQGLRLETYNRVQCNSACTIIFAAGQVRKASRGAKFYFHSVGVEGAGNNHDAIQLKWAKIWSGQIAMVDPRLAQELEQDETLIGYAHEKTYRGGQLFDGGYSYVTVIP